MTNNNQTRVFLGFGGNLGNPYDHFCLAKQKLAAAANITVVATSPLYITPPIGGPAGQLDYLNGVIEIETGLSPANLLQLCQQIEDESGRVRGVRWGARTLDIDLLLMGKITVETPSLTLPHPRLHQRHFVLLPLNDLAPQFIHPILNKSIASLLATLPAAEGISRWKETW